MLLSDEKVAEFLKTEVVPSWEMVREVPKVTIDFGKGKVLKRTLAGNTAMYLCNSKGEVVDAFPGVYTPEDFLRLARQSVTALGRDSADNIRNWHAKRVRGFIDPRMSGSKAMVESPMLSMLRRKPTSLSKGAAQSPVVGGFTFGGSANELPPLKQNATPQETFQYASQALQDISKEPATSTWVMRRVGGDPATMTPEERGKWIVRQDSLNNVWNVRMVVHLWLASLDKPATPAQALDDMFEKILHIPYKDPYLGLADVAIPGTPHPAKGNG